MDISVRMDPTFLGYVWVEESGIGGGMGIGTIFPTQTPQTFNVPAGGSIENVESLGAFPAGSWTVEARFTDPLISTASVTVGLQ
jgi:hypothetical protein